jgi:aspartate/methionine/tyrosine aminotransferase
MISQKFDYASEEDPVYKLLVQKKKQNQQIVDLTISNPTILDFDYSEFFQKTQHFEFVEYTPNPKGLVETREEISDYYKSLGRTVSPENIFLTSGTSEAISYICKLFCDPSDTVLVPSPGYPLFDFILELENLNIERYEFLERVVGDRLEWRLDFELLEKKMKLKPKLLILVQPNNPTGTVITESDAKHLKEILVKYHTILVVDEVFLEYIYNQDILASEFEDVPSFYLNGISKMLALPQMKLSWMYTKGFAKQEEKVHSKMEIITDTFLTVNTPIQKMFASLWKKREYIQRQIKERVNNNIFHLQKHKMYGIDFYKPDAGWYGILEFSGRKTDEEVCTDLLEKYNIYIHPGYMFQFRREDYLVFSLLTKESDILSAFEKISNHFI